MAHYHRRAKNSFEQKNLLLHLLVQKLKGYRGYYYCHFFRLLAAKETFRLCAGQDVHRV